MQRITVRDLERKIEYLNKISGLNYELDIAYGGYCLREGGWAKLDCGYTTKRYLYDCIEAYLEGIKLGIQIGKNTL